MASEDHDFEEINHAFAFGKKVMWNSTQKGAVGEFSTEGLQEVITELKTILTKNTLIVCILLRQRNANYYLPINITKY